MKKSKKRALEQAFVSRQVDPAKLNTFFRTEFCIDFFQTVRKEFKECQLPFICFPEQTFLFQHLPQYTSIRKELNDDYVSLLIPNRHTLHYSKSVSRATSTTATPMGSRLPSSNKQGLSAQKYSKGLAGSHKNLGRKE